MHILAYHIVIWFDSQINWEEHETVSIFFLYKLETFCRWKLLPRQFYVWFVIQKLCTLGTTEALNTCPIARHQAWEVWLLIAVLLQDFRMDGLGTNVVFCIIKGTGRPVSLVVKYFITIWIFTSEEVPSIEKSSNKLQKHIQFWNKFAYPKKGLFVLNHFCFNFHF